MEGYSRWQELSKDVKEKVLARLPLECVGRFCSVSKEWNAVLSSTRFLKTLWAQTPPNRIPWLVAVWRLDGDEFCQSYSFITKTWENHFSFSFLREKAAAIPWASCVGIDCKSSAAGLCIVGLKRVSLIDERLPPEENFLCNPITRTFVQLPNIPSPESIGIIEGQGNSYKIVAFSKQPDISQMKVSIYDPSQNIWTMVGQLPSNLKLAHKPKMVASKNSVYCLVDIEPYVYSIVGFNIEDGTSNIIPFPKFLRTCKPEFLACGGRLLVVGYVHIDAQVEVQDKHGLQNESEFEDEDESEFEAEDKFDIGYEREQLVIWELEENVASSSNSSPSSCWKEIARMPSSVCVKLRSSDIIGEWPCYFDCVGAGNYVVFSIFKTDRIFYYDLSDQSWETIPTENCHLNLFAFEPRPDVKVE